MNPRLVLNRARSRPSCSTFWEDFRAGRKPVMLLMTPPQHGKSLSVIDFIAWAWAKTQSLRVIYS